MHRPFLATGSILAFLAIAAGAFGAHALEGSLDARSLEIFETAARYHMYHALALVFVGFGAARWPGAGWSGPGILFATGVAIFSGSLYALALTGVGWLGAITPIGGACLLAGWGWLAILALRAR